MPHDPAPSRVSRSGSAQRLHIGSLQPTTLVSHEAEIDPVFDGRDEAALRTVGMDRDGLADPARRDRMRALGEAPTQGLARRLMGEGFHGLPVRSFAPGAGDQDPNLVLRRWGDTRTPDADR